MSRGAGAVKGQIGRFGEKWNIVGQPSFSAARDVEYDRRIGRRETVARGR
jgi:hypothetical protein